MSEKTIIGKTLKTSNPKTFVKFSNGAACVDIQFSVMVTYIKNLNLQPIKKKTTLNPFKTTIWRKMSLSLLHCNEKLTIHRDQFICTPSINVTLSFQSEDSWISSAQMFITLITRKLSRTRRNNYKACIQLNNYPSTL